MKPCFKAVWKRLTDGSQVYDVVFHTHFGVEPVFIYAAADQVDADDVCDALNSALRTGKNATPDRPLVSRSCG